AGPRRGPPPARATAHPGGVSGPVLVVESATHGRVDAPRGVARAPPGRPRPDRPPRRRTLGPGRASGPRRRPVSLGFLRWAAAADLYRTGARRRPRRPDRRRTRQRARRIDPGADPQPAIGPAGSPRPEHDLHQPR